MHELMKVGQVYEGKSVLDFISSKIDITYVVSKIDMVGKNILSFFHC